MKQIRKSTVDREKESEFFFTEPLKLPRLKKAQQRIDEGYLPHIVFDQDLGRWRLKINE